MNGMRSATQGDYEEMIGALRKQRWHADNLGSLKRWRRTEDMALDNVDMHVKHCMHLNVLEVGHQMLLSEKTS